MLLRIFTFAFVFLFHTCAAYKLDNPHFLGRNALTEPFNLFKDAPVHTSPLIRDDHQLLKRSRFRAFLDISDLNAPATNMDAEDSEIIRDAFAVARSLGIAMLRLQQNDPRYQAAFGDLDGEMYNIVMRK
jgi:hypothetical protein